MENVVVDCRVDVIFVMEASAAILSAGNMNYMKTFVSNVVGNLNVNSGNTRVGAITFSTAWIPPAMNLNAHSTVSGIQNEVLTFGLTWGETNTGDVLEQVRTNMLTPAAGDRADVENVIVLLTADESNDPTKTEVCCKVQI